MRRWICVLFAILIFLIFEEWYCGVARTTYWECKYENGELINHKLLAMNSAGLYGKYRARRYLAQIYRSEGWSDEKTSSEILVGATRREIEEIFGSPVPEMKPSQYEYYLGRHRFGDGGICLLQIQFGLRVDQNGMWKIDPVETFDPDDKVAAIFHAVRDQKQGGDRH